MTSIVIHADPSLGFFRTGAPPAAAIVYKRLSAISAVRRPLGPDASIGSTTVELDNSDGALTRLFENPPLRARASIASSGLSFGGLVANVRLGATLRLDIEAGGFWSLADLVPLRNTTAWGKFKEIQPIPHAYNRPTLTPLQYDQAGRVFVLADHPIAGVDEVLRDDVATVAFKHYNALDSSGRAVAFLELVEPLAGGESLTARIRGKLHPVTGALLTRPAEILHDFLRNLCGFDLAMSDFDELRAQTADLEIHGLINQPEITIRSQVDEIARSIGAVWSPSMPGFARLWPYPDDPTEPARKAIGARAAVEAASDHTQIYTVLRVLYDFDHAGIRHRRSLQVEAPEAVKTYGRIERELDARWLRSSRDAQRMAERLLADDARPRWDISAEDELADVPPGTIVTLDHPRSPVSGRQLVFSADADTANNRLRLDFQAPSGSAPAVILTNTSAIHEPVIAAGAAVELTPNGPVFTIRGENGEPLRNARVTLDGTITRTTDANGRVQFQTGRGNHVLYVEAPGYAPMLITVPV